MRVYPHFRVGIPLKWAVGAGSGVKMECGYLITKTRDSEARIGEDVAVLKLHKILEDCRQRWALIKLFKVCAGCQPDDFVDTVDPPERVEKIQNYLNLIKI